MPRRKSTFTTALQKKYLFIKQKSGTTDITCEKCRTNFSVGRGSASDIEKHLKSAKLSLADQAAGSSSSMFAFFKRTDLPTSKDLQENHSFRSNDCGSNLIQTCVLLQNLKLLLYM